MAPHRTFEHSIGIVSCDCQIKKTNSKFGALAACVFFWCFTQSASAQEDKIKTLAANIRANEQRYHNIDMLSITDYASEKDWPEMPQFLVIKRSRLDTRLVCQGEFYFMNEKSETYSGKSKVPMMSERFTAFDGTFTRVLAGDIANFRHGRVGGLAPYSPHSDLFEPHNIRCALASFVEGGKAYCDDPFSRPNQSSDIRTTYVSEDVINGRKMDKVRIEMRNAKSDPEAFCAYHLWLDRERNYLPHKAEGFKSWKNKISPIPNVFLSIHNVKQISEGVWMPHEFKVVGYELDALIEKGQHVLDNTRVKKVTKVQLSPKNDISLFSNIAFPKGTNVYEVKGDVILRNYIEGEAQKPQTKP